MRASVDDGATFLPSISLQTTPQPLDGKFWGDIVGIYDGNFWGKANGVTNFNDAFAVIQNWMGHPNAASLQRTDVASQYLNRVVNANDLLFTIFAFKGKTYQFGCPDDPCQDNIENPCP